MNECLLQRHPFSSSSFVAKVTVVVVTIEPITVDAVTV